ncbi:MAG: RNA polymerase sigma factor [Cyclobacteriaceae bacterium]|nr:RNA polymerase sigma factor [Cyclobacteriaceae bacterium HetDA_MAG_MS6]
MSEQEFGSVLASHSRPLMGFAMKLTKDYDDANDLLQETLIKAYRNQGKFQMGTNLSAWLHTIMKNSFITQYQRMVRQKTFIDTTEDLHHLNIGTRRSPDDAIAKMSLEDLQNAVESIGERYSVPFMMYFRGFKYLEIADRLQLPLGTVKNRIHLARKMLQDRVSY